jgi:uncharacterized protein (DUF1330 family)
MKNWIGALIIATTMALPTFSLGQSQPVAAAPPAYLLVIGRTTDRAKIGTYAAALPPIYAQNNAYYLAIGGASRGVTWLEGPLQDRSIILGKFPSRAQVDSFWWGESYREAIGKRDNAGVFSVVALEGTSTSVPEGVGAGFLIVMTAPKDASAGQAQLSQQASEALGTGVLESGGRFLTQVSATAFTAMEGDVVFNHISVAAWPSLGERERYLASRPAAGASRLRARLGLSAVASANGVARNQAPPATTPR